MPSTLILAGVQFVGLCLALGGIGLYIAVAMGHPTTEWHQLSPRARLDLVLGCLLMLVGLAVIVSAVAWSAIQGGSQ
ncbi:hypothetical protein [Halomonas organivorans]|uniref:Uncharacterized protein n=2 Tax=Halomonas organivorans TaxID=257772 RepID=A0A7W5C0T6_9GAMM|nr:hypothetical protein [Halomonas organivorans]